MPGKGKGGKGKGKGKEVAFAPAPPPPPKMNNEAEQALLDVIIQLGEFNIRNWDEIYHEFFGRGFTQNKSTCQTRWSRSLREQYQNHVRAMAAAQLYNFPQGMALNDDAKGMGSPYPPLDGSPHPESWKMGSEIAQTVASTVAGGSSRGRHAPPSTPLPITPRRLPAIPEGVEPGTTGKDNEHMPVLLYNEFHQYMGKIEVKNGFRTIDIINTLQISLPMAVPVSTWPAEMNSSMPQEPDNSVIDPQINMPDRHVFTPLGVDGTTLHREAYELDIDHYIESGAFDSRGDENQPE
ncbi:hypothetical protein PG985_008507 [Apiospora marii]|uniref:Myb-like domain-containing protein n=1 Tax=Apiospora marii TaxID=335849 RepID=A0ABR1STY7_9PEZI